jgi:hypothetical protein
MFTNVLASHAHAVDAHVMHATLCIVGSSSHSHCACPPPLAHVMNTHVMHSQSLHVH